VQREELVIRLEKGLHVRPSAVFSQKARRFSSKVTLLKNNNAYDGKSVYEVLGMCAGKGDKVALVTEGEDETAALAALRGLLAEKGADGDEIPGSG